MIVGLGIDIVHINRLTRWLTIPGILERYFNPIELAAARKRGSAIAVSLAARFAAKEAFGKALGTGLSGIRLIDITVKNNHNHKPEIAFFNTALEAFKRSGAQLVHLSLTHEQDNAVAVVVLEK